MRNRLVIAAVLATVLVAAVVVVVVTRGSGGSPTLTSSARPPAALIRKLLRLSHLHPTSCVQHGSQVTCELANGGRCKVTVGGSGSCSGASGLSGDRIQMVTGTATTMELP